MSEAVVYADGRLGDELAAILDPQLQGALNHPTRRGILRILHASGRSCGVTEILNELPLLRREQIQYHARVLSDAGTILVDGTRSAPWSREVLFRSAVGEEAGVIAVLRDTEQVDRKRLRGKGTRPLGFPTMLRVLRPSRAIRLGGCDSRKPAAGE